MLVEEITPKRRRRAGSVPTLSYQALARGRGVKITDPQPTLLRLLCDPLCVFLPLSLSVAILFLSLRQLQCPLSRIPAFVSRCLARSAPNSRDGRCSWSNRCNDKASSWPPLQDNVKEKEKNDQTVLHVATSSLSSRSSRCFSALLIDLFCVQCLKRSHISQMMEKERRIIFSLS